MLPQSSHVVHCHSCVSPSALDPSHQLSPHSCPAAPSAPALPPRKTPWNIRLLLLSPLPHLLFSQPTAGRSCPHCWPDHTLSRSPLFLASLIVSLGSCVAHPPAALHSADHLSLKPAFQDTSFVSFSSCVSLRLFRLTPVSVCSMARPLVCASSPADHMHAVGCEHRLHVGSRLALQTHGARSAGGRFAP